MKSCPTCNRTFEDTFTFCLADGSLLNPPFDPHATLVIPEPRVTEPPPTEVKPKDETRPEIPPTIASPQPEQRAEESVSTIAAPAPVFESPQFEASPIQPARKSKRWLWITGAIALLIIVAAAVFIMREIASKRAAQHVATAEKLIHYNEFPGAEKEYRQALSIEPNNADVHFLLYQALNVQEKTAEADVELREAIRLNPNVAMWHYELGSDLERQGYDAGAEAEYREALRLKPGDSLYSQALKEVLAIEGK